MNTLLKQLLSTSELKPVLISILKNDEINSELFELADKIRKENVGDEVYLRGLIEFSNICKCNCFYCGLRSENHTIERYRLEPKQIIELATNAKNIGYKTVVLQSGEDSFYTIEKMQYVIKEIKKLNVAITLSLGEKTFEEYKAYKNAGADRYLLRIETTDKNLYNQLHPNMSFENRIRCLKDLKKLDYEVGSGFLVGLPNQTISSTADDIIFLKDINVDMAGIGPFIPTPNTPLSNADSENNFLLSLKAMALVRILLPKINIPATTAMETLNPNGRLLALKSGANVVMPNATDENSKSKYKIYPGKTSSKENAIETYNNIKQIIENTGRPISTNFGNSKNKQN